MQSMTKKIFYVVNVDWFFISHRLPLGIAMLDEGYEVYLLSRDTGRFDELNRLGIKTIDINFDRSGKNVISEIKVIRQLRKIYKKYNPRIIHHVTIKPVLYGSIAAKGLKKTTVINAISGLGYNFIGDRKGLTQKVLSALMNYAYSGNVNFIFQNPDDLEVYKNRGFLKDKYFTIIKGAGVDALQYPFTPPEEKDVVNILFVARFLKDKGINEYIGAAILLEPTWKHRVVFRLLGDIDENNPSSLTREEVDTVLKDRYIVWDGFSKDVRPNIIASDIVCLPSYREGLPKALIEAMAIGRPIVTTDVPGCRECVDNGINGLLVPAMDSVKLADAIEKILMDKSLRIQMGKASREKMLRELSLDKVLSKTIAFYHNCLLNQQ